MTSIKNSDKLSKKKEGFLMKVTTRIRGTVKKKFIEDCETKEILESQLSREIIDIYYKVVENIPRYEYMDMPEVKKYISERIKF